MVFLYIGLLIQIAWCRFTDKVLGPGVPGVCVDAAHVGGLGVRPELLPGGHGSAGAGRGRPDDPVLGHAIAAEPLPHQDLLAGHPLQDHRGTERLGLDVGGLGL